jgi:hypothetical protein
VAAFNKTARQSSEGVRPHNPIGDRIALAHLTVEDDRAGSLVPDLDAELVDPTSARELSVNDG